jgi:hypothetical protein
VHLCLKILIFLVSFSDNRLKFCQLSRVLTRRFNCLYVADIIIDGLLCPLGYLTFEFSLEIVNFQTILLLALQFQHCERQSLDKSVILRLRGQSLQVERHLLREVAKLETYLFVVHEKRFNLKREAMHWLAALLLLDTMSCQVMVLVF